MALVKIQADEPTVGAAERLIDSGLLMYRRATGDNATQALLWAFTVMSGANEEVSCEQLSKEFLVAAMQLRQEATGGTRLQAAQWLLSIAGSVIEGASLEELETDGIVKKARKPVRRRV